MLDIDVLDSMDPHVRSVLEALVIKQLAVEPERLRMDANFIKDLGADSLDMVDIMLALEEELGLHISEKELVHMTTVGDAVRYLTERLSASKVATPELDQGQEAPP